LHTLLTSSTVTYWGTFIAISFSRQNRRIPLEIKSCRLTPRVCGTKGQRDKGTKQKKTVSFISLLLPLCLCAFVPLCLQRGSKAKLQSSLQADGLCRIPPVDNSCDSIVGYGRNVNSRMSLPKSLKMIMLKRLLKKEYGSAIFFLKGCTNENDLSG
jgi:hypothetical protein